MKVPTVYLIAGGAVAAALLWAASRGAKGTGQAIGGAVVDMATGILSGIAEPVTVGVGSVLDKVSDNAAGQAFQEVTSWIGVPKTNPTECEKAKAEGRTWDASYACSAGDFLKYVWS